MNFLAHLYLAGDDEGLRLGAMLGDFIRGGLEDSNLPVPALQGIKLHRHIDQFIDALPEVAELRTLFSQPFRRYSGIVIDLAMDHELARRWNEFSSVPLEEFDHQVRSMLAHHQSIVPEDLARFMNYADHRGLFASYRNQEEILFSLKGIGKRLSRSNPLHRVDEIWETVEPPMSQAFELVFPKVQESVAEWLKSPENGNFTAA
jgi:acyl carrier protein phosphodiesterase